MKIARRWSNVGNVTYQIELSEYDAVPPSDQLFVDGLPRSVNRDREAVALYLVLGHWVGEEFSGPFPFSPHVADAIQSDFHPARLIPSPIEYYPKGLPIGTRIVTCCSDLSELNHNCFADLRSDAWNGSIRGLDNLAVASNSFLFMRHSEDVRPNLGMAVMFSENIDADVLQLSTPIETDEFKKLSRLLAAVRLELRAPIRDR